MNAPPTDKPRGAITDSPWFWICIFSGMALVMLTVVELKFGPRQAAIERQFQGRQWSQMQQHGISEQERRERVQFSTPEETVITLGPLRTLAGVVLLISTIALVRQQYRRGRRMSS